MFQLMACFRAMQLFAHSAHLLCSRVVFFQDHEFFGEIYGKAEGWFDSVSERMIGLGQEEQLKLQSVVSAVAQKLQNAPSTGSKENKEYYVYLNTQMDEAKKYCEELCKSGQLSEGTRQLLGGIADEIEGYKYKISRRIK